MAVPPEIFWQQVMGAADGLQTCHLGLRFESLGGGPGATRALDFGRLRLDQLDEMVDDALVLQAVCRHAGKIDLMGIVAAAGETDVGLARLAGAVHHAADHRKGHRRGDVSQPRLQRLDGADDVKLLARAGRAGHDVDAAMAQVQRLQDVEADANLFEMDDTALTKLGIEQLPQSLADALNLMERSELVHDALGEHIFEWFLRNKRNEWRGYKTQVTPFEITRYLRSL